MDMRTSPLPLAALTFSLLVPVGQAQIQMLGRTPTPAPTSNSTLKLVSRDSAGVQGNSWSGGSALCASGRFVAFHSYSDNLVADDTNGTYDVFVRDRLTHTTERVSVDSLGGQANGSSIFPSISPDGRVVAFTSFATNLIAGDLNGQQDVFVHDRETGSTVLASRSTGGAQGNARSELSSLSDDGRFVAFQSFATTLAPDPNGFVRDAFVHDLSTGTTTLVSIGHLGQAADANCDGTTISGDGQSVAFDSSAGNLIPGDTNDTSDVFVREWLAGTIVRASVDSTGAQSNGYSARPSLSGDGRLVAFQSSGALVPDDEDGGFNDVYLHDLLAGQTIEVTATDPGFPSNTSITRPSISAGASRVAFQSVVVHYPFFETGHVHVRDLRRGVTTTLSHRYGEPGDDDSTEPSISANGRVIGFESRATNLVLPDTNAAADIFVRASGGK
jgi:Tol biopolymer transport system component